MFIYVLNVYIYLLDCIYAYINCVIASYCLFLWLSYKVFLKWVILFLNLKFGTGLKKNKTNSCHFWLYFFLFRWQSTCDWYQHSFSPGTDAGYSSSRRKWEGIGWNGAVYGVFATSQDFGDTLHTRKSWCMYYSAEQVIFCMGCGCDREWKSGVDGSVGCYRMK